MIDRPILRLPTSAIAVPEKRIGFFDTGHAANLGALIAANGQHDPIHVKRNGNAAKLPWTLIAGLHRLRGAEKAGLSEIDAIQVADASASADELRQLELSENLDHRQRRPIERAIFMVERARLEEAIDHPNGGEETPQERAARSDGMARMMRGQQLPSHGWSGLLRQWAAPFAPSKCTSASTAT